MGRIVIWIGTGAAATGVGLPLAAGIATVTGLCGLAYWLGKK